GAADFTVEAGWSPADTNRAAARGVAPMLKTTCAAAAALVCALAFAQEPVVPKADAPRPNGEFTGKVVAVYCKTPAHDAFLEEPVIRQLGRRDYLVGRAASLTDGQALPAGTRIWVA